MLNKVCVITIRVPNLENAIDFYSEILGFKVSKYYGEKIASLQHGDIPIILEECGSAVQNPKQNVLIGLISRDLDLDILELKKKGVDFLFDEPKPCPPGRFIIIKDPTGNQIELVEFSSFNS